MARDDSSVRLISNSFYLMVDWITITVLSLIFWLVVGKTLPTAGYGIVATTVNISLLIAAFGMLGIRDVATNLISRFIKKDQMENARGVIKFSIKFVLIGNIIAAAVVALLSPQIAVVMNLPIQSIWLVSMLIFTWGFWLLTTGFLQGMQNMKLVFKSNLIGHIIKVILPIALFFIGLSFLGPIIAFVVSLLVTVFIRIRALPFGKSSPVDGRQIIFTLALPVFIASVMWLVFTNMPNVILNAITSPDVTGLFAIGLTLVTPIVFIPMTLSQAVFPITSGLSVTANPKKRQSKLIALVVKFAAFITLPLIALLLVFSNQIILFFAQPQYLPAAQLLPIIAPAAILLGIGQILVSNIFAIGKPKVTRNITITITVIFLGLSIPATFLFSSFGMAGAYLISMVVLVTMSYLYLRKNIDMRISWPSIGKIFLATLIFATITFPLNSVLQPAVFKIAVAAVGALVYLIVLVPLKYYSMDEVKIIRYLSSRSPSLKSKLAPLERFLLKYV